MESHEDDELKFLEEIPDILRKLLLSLKFQLKLATEIVSDSKTDMETRTKWAHILVQTSGVLARTTKDLMVLDMKMSEKEQLSDEEIKKLENNIAVAKQLVKFIEEAEETSIPSEKQPKKFRQGVIKVLRTCGM